MSASTKRPWSSPTLDTAASCLLALHRAGGEVTREDLRLLLPEKVTSSETEQIVAWLKERGVNLASPNRTGAKRRAPGAPRSRAASDNATLEEALHGASGRASRTQLLTREEEISLAESYLEAREECFEWVTRTGTMINVLCRRGTLLERRKVSIWDVVMEDPSRPVAEVRKEEDETRARFMEALKELRRLKRQISKDYDRLQSRTRGPDEVEARKIGRRIREARNSQVRIIRSLRLGEGPLQEATEEVIRKGRVLLKTQREVFRWEERTGMSEREMRTELMRAAKEGRKARIPGLDADQIRELHRVLANASRRIRSIEGDTAMDRQELARALHKITLARRQMNRIRDRFVATNQRLVYFWAQRYEAKGVPFADLVQEGNLGLLRAVERYDPWRGFRFSTYAVWWIRQAIARAVAAQSRTIRLPVHVQERLQNMRRVAQRTLVSKGRYPTPEELGKAVGISAEEVRDLHLAARLPLSLSTPLGDDEDHVLEDRVADPSAPSPSRSSEQQQLSALISTYLDRLTPRQRFVIELRYGLLDGEPRTLEAVGSQLGVTRERIRQITEQVLERMRKWAKRDGLHPW